MAELKTQKIWLLWRWSSGKNGKLTKVPFASDGGPTGTDEAHRHTWTTYDVAQQSSETQHASGTGFTIPEGYFFLDIDHKDAEDPLAKTLLSRFNSYAERSVSKTGIHIYGKCDLSKLPTHTDEKGRLKLDQAFYQKNPHNGIELYLGGITNRFAVFTGDVIADSPLEDCTAAILTTLDKDMRRSSGKQKYSAKRDGDNREAFDIVCNLRRQANGEKFIRLYDQGDFSGYGSQSEADLALCAMIAFRTGDDPELIDDIFRTSALYREKWDREDYRDATIRKGIEACGGTFHQSKMPHPPFVRFKDSGEPYVVVPLLAKYVRDHLTYVLVRDNAKQGVLKYVYEGGVYRLYSDDMMLGLIKGYIAGYDEELVKMGNVNEALQHINTDLNYIRQDELNADEGLINFENTLLRVTADALTPIPHSPDIYSTIRIPCKWTATGCSTPVFDQYMDDLTNGDRDIQNLLLEVLGVILSNVKAWRMKKALFMVGPGDSGKSVLKSLAERLIGHGNFIGIDLKEIEARFGTGAIYGTRLAGSSDMSFLSVDELKTFKKITGGDSLFAEFKGQQAFEFTYGGFLWFCMNRLPRFGGDDGKWVYDRIMVVRCPNTIPEERQDKELIDKLYAEREGIIFKAVHALQNVIRNGYRFTEPQSVTSERTKYMAENNTVISFFNECMCERDGGKIKDTCTAGKVYQAYRLWCQDNNNGYAKTAREFRTGIADLLGGSYQDVTVHTEHGTCYRTLTLTKEAQTQYHVYCDCDFLA